MTDKPKEETTPDELMEHFHGSSLKTIVLFTVVVHAVLLVGTSIPAILKAVKGSDTSEMSEDERIELAMSEANASLRKIAEDHGLKPQDLSSQFGTGRRRAPKAPRTTPADPGSAEPDASTTPGGDPDTTGTGSPKSSIEKELDKKADGPAVPKIEDEEEDLFK